MKALGLILIGFVFSTQIQAMVVPGWDRPVAKSDQVEILSANGDLDEIQKISLKLKRNDSTGDLKLLLTMDEFVFDLDIIDEAMGECGTKTWLAQGQNDEPGIYLSVKIDNHQDRHCEYVDSEYANSEYANSEDMRAEDIRAQDVKSFKWDVIVEARDLTTKEVLGALMFGTDPVPFFTIQSLVVPAFERASEITLQDESLQTEILEENLNTNPSYNQTPNQVPSQTPNQVPSQRLNQSFDQNSSQNLDKQEDQDLTVVRILK